jgi:hypothetical protein
MKVLCVSLGRNATQSFAEFTKNQGFSTTHFYNIQTVKLNDFSEDADGIMDHFNSLPYSEAHVDIPTCLVFDRLYSMFPDAKYINITRPAKNWVDSMIKMKNHYTDRMGPDRDPFPFEEAYCNMYIKTGKNKIQDLTEDELYDIRQKHLEKVNAFFKGKENYLEVELSDPEIGNKIREFIGGKENIPFPNNDAFRNTNPSQPL